MRNLTCKLCLGLNEHRKHIMQMYQQGSLSSSVPTVCALAQRKPIYKSPLSRKWGSYMYHFTFRAQKIPLTQNEKAPYNSLKTKKICTSCNSVCSTLELTERLITSKKWDSGLS